MVRTVEKYVAVEPYKGTEVAKKQIRGGLSVIDQKVTLVPLKVVFHVQNSDYGPGCVVWIDGNSLTSRDFNQRVYNANGVDFVLVPKELIVMAGLLEDVK